MKRHSVSLRGAGRRRGNLVVAESAASRLLRCARNDNEGVPPAGFVLVYRKSPWDKRAARLEIEQACATQMVRRRKFVCSEPRNPASRPPSSPLRPSRGPEFAHVVGHQCQIESAGRRGDQQVVRADHRAPLFEIGPDLGDFLVRALQDEAAGVGVQHPMQRHNDGGMRKQAAPLNSGSGLALPTDFPRPMVAVRSALFRSLP
jgi:hypothetical protein